MGEFLSVITVNWNKVSSVMERDNRWPATVPSVVVSSFSFSEAVHTTMHTMYATKQAVPVECLDWWLLPQIYSLSQLPHCCLNGWSANPETPKMVELYFRSQIWWQILNMKAHIPIQVSCLLVSEIFTCYRQMDNVVHYYSWPPHCGRPSNNHGVFWLINFSYVATICDLMQNGNLYCFSTYEKN